MNQLFLQIIGFIITFVVSMYFYWEEFSIKFKHGDFKYKNGRPVLPEHVLDVWVFSGLFALVSARVSYVLLNISEFPNKWELTPWIRSAEGKFIWLSRFPWVFIDFLDGLDISVFILLMFILPIIFVIRLGFGLKYWYRPVRRSLLAFIGLSQLAAIVIPVSGLSEDTIFTSKSIAAYVDNSLYFLIGVGLTVLYLAVSKLLLTRDKSRRLRALVFSIYLSIFLLLTKLSQDYDVRWLYFVPFPMILGLVGFLFAKDKEQDELPADISKTRLLRSHVDVQIELKGKTRKKRGAKK